jgi:hypothetical protein
MRNANTATAVFLRVYRIILVGTIEDANRDCARYGDHMSDRSVTTVLEHTLASMNAALEAQLRCVRKVESDLQAFQKTERQTIARSNKQAAILDELRELRQMQQGARHTLDTAFQAARDLLLI